MLADHNQPRVDTVISFVVPEEIPLQVFVQVSVTSSGLGS